VCGKCHDVKYCSRDCQKANFSQHQKVCHVKPPTKKHDELGTDSPSTSSPSSTSASPLPERPSSEGRNVGTWFWTEKDYSSYAERTLETATFQNFEVCNEAGVKAVITKTLCKGDLLLNTRKGKLVAFVNLCLKWSWKGTLEEKTAEGFIKTKEEIAYESLDNFEVDTVATSDSSNGKILEIVQRCAPKALRQKVRAWFDQFWEEKAVGDRHLAGKNDVKTIPPLNPQAKLLPLGKLDSQEELRKLKFKKALSSIWDGISVKKGWFKPSLSYAEAENFIDEASEIVVRICMLHELGGHHLSPLDGSAKEFLWTLLYQPSNEFFENKDKNLRDIVHAAFTDTEGYVLKSLMPNFIEDCITVWKKDQELQLKSQRERKGLMKRIAEKQRTIQEFLDKLPSLSSVEMQSTEDLMCVDKKLSALLCALENYVSDHPDTSCPLKRRKQDMSPAQAPAPASSSATSPFPTLAIPTPPAPTTASTPAPPDPTPAPPPTPSASPAPVPPTAATPHATIPKATDPASEKAKADALKSADILKETLLHLDEILGKTKNTELKDAIKQINDISTKVKEVQHRPTSPISNAQVQQNPKDEELFTSHRSVKDALIKKWDAMRYTPKFEMADTPFSYRIAAYIPNLKAEPKVALEKNGTQLRVEGVKEPTAEEISGLEQFRDRMLAARGLQANSEQKMELMLKLGAGRFGTFSEVFQIPDDVDVSDIESSYDRGKLTIDLPKIKTQLKPLRRSSGNFHSRNAPHPFENLTFFSPSDLCHNDVW